MMASFTRNASASCRTVAGSGTGLRIHLFSILLGGSRSPGTTTSKVSRKTPSRPLIRIFATCLSCLRFMKKLRAFYQQYRQYILTDGLMYLIFILFIALLFVFFS
jgi:hypothetical protein